MNTARCRACNTVVSLPHAKARASHARCEECHRRAAASAERAARLDEPEAAPWNPLTPAGRQAVANMLLDEGKIETPQDYLAILTGGERLAPYRMAEPKPTGDEKLLAKAEAAWDEVMAEPVPPPPRPSGFNALLKRVYGDEMMGPSGWARRGLT